MKVIGFKDQFGTTVSKQFQMVLIKGSESTFFVNRTNFNLILAPIIYKTTDNFVPWNKFV